MRDPRFDDNLTWPPHREATPEELDQAGARAREIAADPAGVERIRQASQENHAPSWWYAFDGALVVAIREHSSLQRAWSDSLANAVDTEKQRFPFAGERNEAARALLAAAADWRSERDPFSAWGHPSSHSQMESYYLREASKLLSQLNRLVRIDSGRGLQVCDTLPFPGMMASVFYWGYDVRKDRELIEELLLSAPTVFEGDGTWKPERSVAALLLTDLIVEHAQMLHRAVKGRIWRMRAPASRDDAQAAEAERTLQAVEATELPRWMRRAFGILLRRPDGRAIALGYLAHLVERTYGRQTRIPGQEEKEWSAFEHGRDLLCEILVAAGVTTAQVREGWKRAEEIAADKARQLAARRMVRRMESGKRSDRVGEGARTLYGNSMSYLWGAALMLGDDPQAGDDIDRLWSWFEDFTRASRMPSPDRVSRAYLSKCSRRSIIIVDTSRRTSSTRFVRVSPISPRRSRRKTSSTSCERAGWFASMCERSMTP